MRKVNFYKRGFELTGLALKKNMFMIHNGWPNRINRGEKGLFMSHSEHETKFIKKRSNEKLHLGGLVVKMQLCCTEGPGLIPWRRTQNFPETSISKTTNLCILDETINSIYWQSLLPVSMLETIVIAVRHLIS